MKCLPQIQAEVLDYLNADPYFQRVYGTYRANLERQAQYDKDQFEKLDSLTSQFYFEDSDAKAQFGAQHGLLMGERKVHLFLKDIEQFMERKKQRDSELAYCTAPIVLEQPFVVSRTPENGRLKNLILAFLIGWLCACAIAYAVELRNN